RRRSRPGASSARSARSTSASRREPRRRVSASTRGHRISWSSRVSAVVRLGYATRELPDFPALPLPLRSRTWIWLQLHPIHSRWGEGLVTYPPEKKSTHGEQLDLEHQRRVVRDEVREAAIAIGELGR